MSARPPLDIAETQSPADRESRLWPKLRAQVTHAKQNAPHYAALYAKVEPQWISGASAFAALPLLRKSDLPALQASAPPFGGLAAIEPGAATLILQSPGPIHEPEGAGPDYWRSRRALHAAGFGDRDIVLNTFSYHLSPGAWILHGGLLALGCAVLPAGPGNTDQTLAAMAACRPTGYVGVPDFLKILLDKADEAKIDCRSLRKALVSGAALPGSLRAEFEGRGLSVLQAYAIGDFGIIAYETIPGQGLVVDEGVYVEIVRPGTGDLAGEGEVGEVVVTVLSQAYPLIRFATGDLSAFLPGPSPCGRTGRRLKGWMGRADQSAKVKGLFVTPALVAEALRRHPGLGKARLVIGRTGEQDVMTLKVEAESNRILAEAVTLAVDVAESVRAVTKLSCEVEFVTPGSLANDGRVIDDTRRVDG